MTTAQPKQPSRKNTFSPEESRWTHVKNHLRDDVSSSLLAEMQLVILTFCTGIQDATTFPTYHCFVSNQTGNTVFLCMALVLPRLNGDMFVTSNIGMALGVFLGAGWLTGQLSHLVGPRKRWWLILCNLLQSGSVLGAAAIEFRHGSGRDGAVALSVVGLLAFAAGSQVVQSRSLAIPEISTAMATAAWVDLVIDRKLLTLRNRPRNRRVAFLFSLALGAVTGAGVLRTAGSATAVAVSGSGKLLVTVMYLFTSAEQKAIGRVLQSAV